MKHVEDLEKPASHEFVELMRIIACLRGDKGCPWDRVQTHETLKSSLLEETYEVLDAIDSGDPEKLREELGDLMMQVVMHAQLANEGGQFSLDQSLASINTKLVRRHPHVFGDGEANTPDEVLRRWDAIKSEDNGHQSASEKIKDIPAALPALIRAAKVQKAAATVGFDWASPQGALEKVGEEIAEIEGADLSDREAVAEEVGDLLFAAVNVARLLKTDAEEALRQATKKFEQRFSVLEQRVTTSGKSLTEMTLDEMDEIWNEVKQTEPV